MSTDRRQLDITHTGAPMQQRTMYDERFLVPMRRDLTEVGFTELHTAEEVDKALQGTPGTAMVLVNSVCGCSARMARPAARVAVSHATKPDHLYTVFAGQDAEATEKAEEYAGADKGTAFIVKVLGTVKPERKTVKVTW